MTPGIDIIVVGYHQPQDSREFYDALIACADRTPWEATYVSVEATEEDVKLGNELYGPEAHLVCRENVGHASACNLAALRAQRDTLFFCNADTRLYTGVIDACYQTLWSDGHYGCVGPRQVDEKGRITHAGIFGTLDRPRHRGWLETGRKYQDSRDDAVMVSGSLYMVKRHVWDEMAACESFRDAERQITGRLPIGAMPAVKHYYSETGVSYHMYAHGYKNVYEGKVTARHDWHKASPHGGWGEKNLAADRDHFRRLCDSHRPPIAHD